MPRRINLIGRCLLSMFIVMFGSILVMPLLSNQSVAPAEINFDAVAATAAQ
ncbi:hypothetical protein GB928_028880 [Shinella curvata]|uniref:Uncharacterized protein n=1 Tax=Shinella curvata TaxID=1817964 RepID=A0ABT8XN84_9HYPH|nr:hypothetical protein [Shinella curvata]MCJ8057313.1 hypothetical protein [Shinella curvata]MDO6125200.1 hypothetical protein [Shinella curvata]